MNGKAYQKGFKFAKSINMAGGTKQEINDAVKAKIKFWWSKSYANDFLLGVSVYKNHCFIGDKQ